MEIALRASGVTVDDLQRSIDAAWAEAVRAGRVSDIVGPDEATPSAADAGDCPFRANAEGDNFGVLELIAIAAAGRLAASIPERLLTKLFDEVVWPKLVARFGGALKRPEDDE